MTTQTKVNNEQKDNHTSNHSLTLMLTPMMTMPFKTMMMTMMTTSNGNRKKHFKHPWCLVIIVDHRHHHQCT